MARRVVDLDRLTAAGVRDGELDGRSITVLGLARSGIAMARFFADAGVRVTAYDGKPAAELGPALEALGGRRIELALGPEVEPASAWASADLVATSPSISPDFPTTEPRLRAALAALVAAQRADPLAAPALVSEADLFLRMCPCPTVGVTGTKGKTTTASLAAALLATDADHPAILGGNIGLPLIERLADLTPRHRVVIELSELQLPTLSRGTTVAAYTNVTSDHLDRHGSLTAYRAVKRRLAELVDPAGALVLNAEDPVVAAYADLRVAPVVTYRRDRPLPGGLGIEDGWIVAAGVQRLAPAGGAAAVGSGGRIMPLAELAIPGAHNVSNALAAIAVALLFGIPAAAIRRAAAAFAGVEHRLELVATVDGVRFINDSQGTQPDAVIAALRAFPRPLVLIAGGRDKGVDLSGLGPVAAERADGAVLIGESGPALEALFRESGVARVERVATLEAAVSRADALAREALARQALARDALAAPDAGGAQAETPATVLLSPAAASFDMFVDYAARGVAFREAVAALASRRARGRFDE
ncbi:MAG: UDP-N-acetylmuramoyl-L-alanine--D-glutamate ligase [Candidatus Limnocylindrales bacterium]|jgi:UDP-N-acetylmuramoylalanine--D-glutamate ligase